jgi:hypothetical protein
MDVCGVCVIHMVDRNAKFQFLNYQDEKLSFSGKFFAFRKGKKGGDFKYVVSSTSSEIYLIVI